MGKQVLNKLLANMKKAGIVFKETPWMFEDVLEVRYVGIKPKDWDELMSRQNNLFLKLISTKQRDSIELYLANKPPFIRLGVSEVSKDSKWEVLLGNFKRYLRHDKDEYIKGVTQIDNLYVKIVDRLHH